MNLKNVIVDKVQTMKDKSIKVTLITRELPPEAMAELFSALLTEKELVSFDPEKGLKSPATRLRGVLYRLWEKHYQEKYEDYEVFYVSKMERLIESIKEKI